MSLQLWWFALLSKKRLDIYVQNNYIYIQIKVLMTIQITIGLGLFNDGWVRYSGRRLLCLNENRKLNSTSF
jgi:hypothetical protein